VFIAVAMHGKGFGLLTIRMWKLILTSYAKTRAERTNGDNS
jgi:hypothetical protein